MFDMEERWLPIVKKQAELIRFQKFDREDALALGLQWIELAKSKYHRTIACQVILADNTIVFSHLMEGTNIENNWWMQKKLNAVLKTGVNSLQAGLEFAYGVREAQPWCEDQGQYALCGGCMPILLEDQTLVGYALVSNMLHQWDHQLTVDGMAALAGVEIPSILEEL